MSISFQEKSSHKFTLVAVFALPIRAREKSNSFWIVSDFFILPSFVWLIVSVIKWGEVFSLTPFPYTLSEVHFKPPV
jgi:hypothetical protein